MYAIIKLRGEIKTSPQIKKTLELLNLKAVNNMSIWPEKKENLKMLKKVENYTTFGIIGEEVLNEVITKKAKTKSGEIDTKKVIDGLAQGKNLKELGIINCFRLSPPKKGHQRKGIKRPFSIGGALGDRKEKIDELIKKMM